jgi:hypothetical protein
MGPRDRARRSMRAASATPALRALPISAARTPQGPLHAAGRAPAAAAPAVCCGELIGSSMLLPIASRPVVQLAVVRQKEADLVHDEPAHGIPARLVFKWGFGKSGEGSWNAAQASPDGVWGRTHAHTMQGSELGGGSGPDVNRCERHREGLTFTHCRVVAPQDVRPTAADVDQLVLPICLLRELACLRGQPALRAISGQGWWGEIKEIEAKTRAMTRNRGFLHVKQTFFSRWNHGNKWIIDERTKGFHGRISW